MRALNRELRLELLQFLDGLTPASAGPVPSTLTLAPTGADSDDYRMGWEACLSEVKGYLLPLVGFVREAWRHGLPPRAAVDWRQRRIAIGMCIVATCDARAVEGARCGKHAAGAAAPAVLTAEEVLAAARARGVPAFGSTGGARRVLLASLGLELANPDVRAALLALHRRYEIRIERLAAPAAARADLAARGLRPELVDESMLSDGPMVFHLVEIP